MSRHNQMDGPMLVRYEHHESICFIEDCNEYSKIMYRIDGDIFLPVCADHDVRLRVEMLRLLNESRKTHYTKCGTPRRGST